MNKKIIIAIDAMGGENSPAKNIEGILIFLNKNKKKNDIFFNIYGDVAVNKKMKLLLQIFYDILLKINYSKEGGIRINKSLISKYLKPEIKESEGLIEYLIEYYENFYYFCFELENNSMLKGQINFKHLYNYGRTKT